MPKVGDLVRKVNIGRITRTFGTLLSSGVPILQALNITKDITENYYYSKALERIHDKVRDGESLSAPMELESVFPNMVTSMVDVGEETGELDKMLNRIKFLVHGSPLLSDTASIANFFFHPFTKGKIKY